MRTLGSAYQGIRNARFSEKLAYVLNELSFTVIEFLYFY